MSCLVLQRGVVLPWGEGTEISLKPGFGRKKTNRSPSIVLLGVLGMVKEW